MTPRDAFMEAYLISLAVTLSSTAGPLRTFCTAIRPAAGIEGLHLLQRLLQAECLRGTLHRALQIWTPSCDSNADAGCRVQ